MTIKPIALSVSTGRGKEILWVVALLVAVALVWCFAYNRWGVTAWSTPVVYSGDAWAEVATAKAYAFDGVRPIVQKYPARLGAPFVANWNDYISAEEGVFAWYGLLVRLFGVGLGSNIAVLSAHLLAAAAFYAVCRAIDVRPVISCVFAALFAMSHYAFARSLPHLVLTFYWHVPLGILVVWWSVDRPYTVRKTPRLAVALVTAIVHAVQYPYYTGMFLQFLALSTGVNLIRRRTWKDILTPVGIAIVVLSFFLLVNLDTITFRIAHGANEAVSVRIYSALEEYALKPVELLLPLTHRLGWLQQWARQNYFEQTILKGEAGSAYIGIVAIGSLLWMCWSAVVALASRPARLVPRHCWLVLWVLAYSVVGGINGCIGTLGMVLFRGTNRYSIVIMCLALLYAADRFNRATARWSSVAVFTVAGLLFGFGLWDQLPTPPTSREILATHDVVSADRDMADTLEKRLGRGAMIFEMPVSDYPEVPPVRHMLDYEHFRPYIHSYSLRYSYGSDKGRTRERWQHEAEGLDTLGLVALLEKYQFAAVLINRKAYDESAKALEALFVAAGRTDVIFRSAEFLCLRLHPAPTPNWPPDFDPHWYGLEGSVDENLRWSNGSATIDVYNGRLTPLTAFVSFGLGTLVDRAVDVSGPTGLLSRQQLPAGGAQQVELKILINPGTTKLRFTTDKPAELPGNGDSRKLAFNVTNFDVVYERSSPETRQSNE